MKKVSICHATFKNVTRFNFVLEYDLSEIAEDVTINGHQATITARITAIDSDGDSHIVTRYLDMPEEEMFLRVIDSIKAFCAKHAYNSNRGSWDDITFEMSVNPIAKKCLNVYYKKEIESRKRDIERAKQSIAAMKEKNAQQTLTF